MSETPCELELPQPALGEHSVQILQENGFSEDEIESLLSDEVTKSTIESLARHLSLPTQKKRD
jgi:hypothetical protein